MQSRPIVFYASHRLISALSAPPCAMPPSLRRMALSDFTVTYSRSNVISCFLDDHNAMPGAGSSPSVKADPKLVHDAGQSQKIPRHDLR
jgi:hypothetical protein